MLIKLQLVNAQYQRFIFINTDDISTILNTETVELDSATAQAVRGQAVQGYNITTIATRSGSRWLVHGSVNEIAKLAGHKPA